MNATGFIHRCCGMCLLVLPTVWLAGCGKPKSAAPTPPPSPAADAALATPRPAAPVTARPATPDTGLAQAQAALKARDYETATATLLALQQSGRLSDPQAAAVADQMRQLQVALAQAIASGDAKAQAAAEQLRRASLHR